MNTENLQTFNGFFSNIETKALSMGNGGESILTSTMTDLIIDKQKQRSIFRILCHTYKSSTSSLEILVTNSMEDEAKFLGETSAREQTRNGSIYKINIDTYDLFVNIPVTQKFFDDMSIELDQYLLDRVIGAINRAETKAFLYGTGNNEPCGLLTNIEKSKKIIYEENNLMQQILNMYHALDFEERDGACWLMSSEALSRIQQIEKNNLSFSLEKNVPINLLGKPIHVCDQLKDNHLVIFANFRREYAIVDRYHIRLLKDPYTEKPLIHCGFWSRVGGSYLRKQPKYVCLIKE